MIVATRSAEKDGSLRPWRQASRRRPLFRLLYGDSDAGPLHSHFFRGAGPFEQPNRLCTERRQSAEHIFDAIRDCTLRLRPRQAHCLALHLGLGVGRLPR